MDIEFHSEKHESLVNDYERLCKKFTGKKEPHANDIIAALDVLKGAPNLSQVPHFYNVHLLRHNLSGIFAVDILRESHSRGAYRMTFEALGEGIDLNKRQSILGIKIIDICTDYH